MKYIKYIVLICLFVGVLYVGRSLYKKDQTMTTESVPINQTINTVAQKSETVTTTKKQIGDLVFEYAINSKVEKEEIDFLSLSLFFKTKTLDFKNNKILNSDTVPVIFFYSKSQNPKNLPIEKWFDLNNPADEKQSPFEVLSSEKIKIGDIDALKVVFASAPYLTGGYYNLQSVYIAHNSDIYEIQSYALPSIPDPALTQDDIKNITDYQKAVDQIIQGIHFIK